jgi:hypothetical protein
MTIMDSGTVTMAAGQNHLNRYRGAFREAGPARRWIGRCRCGTPVKLDGVPLYDEQGNAAVLGSDGHVYTTRVMNTHEIVLVWHRCTAAAGRWALARPVFDGGKQFSKRHACGARCTNATGPACDCRCRGLNHGSGH